MPHSTCISGCFCGMYTELFSMAGTASLSLLLQEGALSLTCCSFSPKTLFRERGLHPISLCQDEASASRATHRVTMMAAAAVEGAP
jgi:hypothetical protein